MPRRARRLPQDDEASLTYEPLVWWGVFASHRFKRTRPHGAVVLLVVLGLPILLLLGVLAATALR